MFVQHFPYSKVNHCEKHCNEDKYIEHVYQFRGKTNKRYIVIVEEYEHFVFIVKFYLQEKKNYTDRFNHLTNLNECSRVITTIVVIMKSIHDKNPYSSFGFMGSPIPGEQKENNKRYQLYSKVVSQIISATDFEHRSSEKFSAYLLLNRNSQEDDFLNKITEMFTRIYPIQAE